MNDIQTSIQHFDREHGVGNLERVILPIKEYNRYYLQLNQIYPHIRFTYDDLVARIFVHKDPICH